MTTETTTVPLLNPAAFPQVEEVRAEVEAITTLITDLTEPLREIIRRAEGVYMTCQEMQHTANKLVAEVLNVPGDAFDDNIDHLHAYDGMRAIVDALTGVSDLWTVLHTVSNIIHPETIFEAPDRTGE